MKVFTIIFIMLAFVTFAGAVSGQAVPSSESGIELYRAGNIDKSVEALESTVATDKNNGLAWLYLGAGYVRLGRNKEAVKAFRNSKIDFRDSPENFDTPLKVLRKPWARYTDAARQNNTTGEIKIAVEFRADGKIGFVFPFQVLPHGLTQNAVVAASSITFEPAITNGKPVSVVSVIAYGFTIY